MRLLTETQAILDRIEALSSRPVRFMEDRDLSLLTAWRSALKRSAPSTNPKPTGYTST